MAEDFKTLNEILSKFLDDDLREKLVKDMVRMSMDDVILDEYERRTLELIAEIDSKRIEREEGIRENTESIIKSMIENNIDFETISKVTGKTIEEIKEIEKSMNEVE